MDESSETQNLNIFAYKKKVKNSLLQNCALSSPNRLTDQELGLESSNHPQNNHLNFNFEKWDILLDNTRQNSIDQASSPKNRLMSVALQEGDCKLSPLHQPLKNFPPNHDKINDSDQVDPNNKENLIFTTPNHHAKKESFDSVNLFSKSTTGTEKTHLDVILEEFSPQIEYHETDPELLIQIDVVQVSKSFAEYARKKVPRYIKKMQKHIKKIGHQLKHFDLEKDGLMELKNEVRNIHSWNSSWTYSRILLYLTNLLTYFNYQHRVDSNKFGDKLFRKVLKLVTKAYFYARQIIKALFITFNPEEIEAFERIKMEYRELLEQKIDGVQENDITEGARKDKSKKKKKKKNKKHSKKDHDSDDESDDEEFKKMKKLKIEKTEEKDVNLVQVEEGEEDEDDELWRAEPKPKKAKKNFVDIKSFLNKRRKKKKKTRSSNDHQTEVEKRAAIELDNYFDKLTSYYKSTNFVGGMLNSVLLTWRNLPPPPLESEILMSKLEEKSGPAIWEEVNQPQNNNASSSLDFSSFSFSLLPKSKKINLSSAFSAAVVDEMIENENYIEPKIPQKSSSLSSIFKFETFSPETMKIKKKIVLAEKGKQFDPRLARKTTARFFTNNISQKLNGYLKWKGIDYELNTQRMETEFLEKLVLLKFEFKLAEDEEVENNASPQLNIQNKFSVDSFNSFLNLSSEIKNEKFAIQRYPDLFSLEQMRNKTLGVVCAEKILEQLNTEPWKSDASSALYYYSQLRQDEEGDEYYELGVFTVVENFFDFHICFNEKQLF